MAQPTLKPLPSTMAVGLARTKLEVREFFREREALIFTFFFPIIFLGIFSAVFGSTDFDGVNAATYFTPGMIASGIFLSSFQSLAISIALERDEGLLKRLRRLYPELKAMLISNYPDAQAAAVAEGALPGFGKRELGSLRVAELIRGALGAPVVAKA